MATRKRSELEQELMTDANISRVIKLLEPVEEGQKPITKKEACQLLGMAYNTTRLATVIQDFKNKLELDKKRRAERRGKAATKEEIIYAVEEYLKGDSLDAIAKSLYRSSQFVKTILVDNHVPIRAAAHSYFRPALIPDGAVRERFRVGESVYSARYDSVGRIEAESLHKSGEYVYCIWLPAEKWSQYCYQPASELASLEHLRELGAKV